MGITPAHAGTTLSVLLGSLKNEDHPRSRGDHLNNLAQSFISQGSPPLTRGPPSVLVCTVSAPRITPAHAGTTYSTERAPRSASDHPRSRGDHRCLPARTTRLWGSPPLTRGPLPKSLGCSTSARITPAHAGTTGTDTLDSPRKRDHPRSRGDHYIYLLECRRIQGSPPLTRGPHRSRSGALGSGRITPAHAGTTPHSWPSFSPSPDHPRSRGDHLKCKKS